MKIKKITECSEPTFKDVKNWYEKHLHPDSNDYSDQHVYDYVYHKGNFAGIFQLTSAGAQRLFKAAKPKSIVDIAVLTSIYRPGPLAANVDKLYLNARKGEKFDWGHPKFEEVLGKTDNLLIFQEQVMDLAEHIGGFPKDQCDNVRRAIMKRDLSKGEAAIKEAKKMEDDFVAGAAKNGISEFTARKSYQQILWFAGYGFNRAHAVAYAIDSYMCAWLLTYYEEEWLCAYLESMSNNADNREQAFNDIKSMGYTIKQIDINYATASWTILPGKKFMPSFLTCKGVGNAAIEEIIENRPYKNVYDLLWNEDGSWKHSKFNKKALEGLIKVGAFESMNLVGEGKVFNSYRQMHEVLIEHMDELKKTPKRDPGYGRRRFDELLSETSNIPDWTRAEKLEMTQDLLGNYDINLVISPEQQNFLAQKSVKSIDHWEGKNLYWAIAVEVTPKLTKNKKEYLQVKFVGDGNKQYRAFLWGCKDPSAVPTNTAYIAEFDKSDFGFSTNQYKLRKIEDPN